MIKQGCACERERVRLLYIKVRLFPTASIMLHKWCVICQTAAAEKLLHTCLYTHTCSHGPTHSPDFCYYSKQISLLIESLIHTHACNLTLDVTQTSLHTLTATFPQSSSPVPTLLPYVGTHCCNPSRPIINLQHKDGATHHLYLTLNWDLHLDAVWVISSLITSLYPHLEVVDICVVTFPFCSC